MAILNVRHTTTYRYSRPVRFGDHRLMLRPRDSHDLRLIQTSLQCSPPAALRWRYDVFGNSIAIASCPAGYKVPRLVVFGPIPKTSTGKIQKFMLRELARNAMESVS
jgi:transglutaminase-like putative cysteine protease